jgi:hypothetical protein
MQIKKKKEVKYNNQPCCRIGWLTRHRKESVGHIQKQTRQQQLGCGDLNYEGEAQSKA